MKQTKFFRYAALVLAAVCVLTLAGCPTDTHDPDPDPALRGDWTNNAGGNLHPGLIKTFAINNNFTFLASINPTFIGAYNQAYAAAKAQGADEPTAQAAGALALAGLEGQGVTDEATRWTVTGKLTADGGVIYVMSGLKETTGKPAPGQDEPGSANAVLAGFDGQRVKIAFTNNKAAFDFTSANNNNEVTAFFGGNYTKVDPN
ncbi:MAG: hypothetical protein LBL19_00835 [Spirochaetaceae bacterium]|nr:hypothetical protein [Spirochaetaceae bacterium]